MDCVVLAYSGDVETSVAIPWLAEETGAQIVTVTVDVGQGRELTGARERALAIGAVRAHLVDLRETMAREFVLPALQADALDDGWCPLSVALARPLIARQLVEIATIEGASAIAHGGRPSPDHSGRLDALLRALDPGLPILTPRRLGTASTDDVAAFARSRGIPVIGDPAVRVDSNLWGRSLTLASDTGSDDRITESLFARTRPVSGAPDAWADVEVTFERGVPTAINGISMSLVELFESLETIAGVHGVGRLEVVDPRPSGGTIRRVCEAPAAVVLHAAHRALQRVVTPPDLVRLTSALGVQYGDLIQRGRWFSPTRAAIDAFVAEVQTAVSGVVKVRLFKGRESIISVVPATTR